MKERFICLTENSEFIIVCQCGGEMVYDWIRAVASSYSGSGLNGLKCSKCENELWNAHPH